MGGSPRVHDRMGAAHPLEPRRTHVAGARGQVTERIELGSAVMPTWSRHPYAMAQQALTTQAAVGGRLLLGLGPSHPEWVANAYGDEL